MLSTNRIVLVRSFPDTITDMIVVEAFKGRSVTGHRVEIVERKGRGHA